MTYVLAALCLNEKIVTQSTEKIYFKLVESQEHVINMFYQAAAELRQRTEQLSNAHNSKIFNDYCDFYLFCFFIATRYFLRISI